MDRKEKQVIGSVEYQLADDEYFESVRYGATPVSGRYGL